MICIAIAPCIYRHYCSSIIRPTVGGVATYVYGNNWSLKITIALTGNTPFPRSCYYSNAFRIDALSLSD